MVAVGEEFVVVGAGGVDVFMFVWRAVVQTSSVGRYGQQRASTVHFAMGY
jgi:hypothetical protein